MELATSPPPGRTATAHPESARPERGRDTGGPKRAAVASVAHLRVGVVGAIFLVLAIAAGDVFDRRVWVLLPAALLPPALMLVLRRRGVLWQVLGGLVAIAGALVIAVVLSGGTPGDAVEAVTGGPQRMLSTEWPSPDRVDFVGTAAAVIAVMAALAAGLALRKRWHLLPLLPAVAVHASIVALSAPIGVRLRWVVPIGVLAIGFATLREQDGVDEQLSLLRGERRLIPLAALTVVAAAAVSIPLDLAPRADPRRNDPPELTAPLLDPIEATLALRAIDPPIPLHEIRNTGDGPLPTRWRTAALETYDGQRWSPDLVLRPIGRRLGTDDGSAIAVTVRFLDDDLSLLPLPGAPVTVEAPIETDRQRTIVRLIERPGPALEIPLTANVAPGDSDAAVAQVATRPVDESVSGLTELASSLAGDGAIIDRLRAIEQTMRDEFVLETDAPGGGIQRALIERFLRDTNRGNAEQFTTSYVLLARALGVDARVATGYEIDPADAGSVIRLQSSDARIWPEVRLVDGRWLPLDPVPAEEATDVANPPVEPQVQTPAAPQPPIEPPPDPTNDTPLTDESADTAATGALSNAVLWLVRGAAVAGFFLLPLLVVVAVIVGIKRRRRRRRLGAPTAAQRIRGIWATATDAMVDAGMSIESSATDHEIADRAEPLAPSAETDLHRLATLSSAVTFGDPPRADVLADDAHACLDRVEAAMGASLTRWERIRWRLSARSLRRATRSPVDA